MNNRKPIIYTLGVEGHFYLAEAAKNEFERPIVGIVISERIHEMMTPEREAVFDKLYSLPNYYFDNITSIENMSLDALNQEIKALETKLGIPHTSLFTNQDRRIRTLGDYRTVRNWQLCNLRFIDLILSEVNPAFALDGAVIYLMLCLRQACRKKNIPYFVSAGSRNGRLVFIHADGQQVGMLDLFEELQKQKTTRIPPEILKEADEKFNTFLERPKRPTYSDYNAITVFNWDRTKKKLAMAFNKNKIFPSQRAYNLDIKIHGEASFPRICLNFIVSNTRRFLIKNLKIFNAAPDLSVPFIYAPLHYTPEVTDLYYATEYDHHEAYIVHLSKYIPSGTQLYVKEHTSMLGRRPLRFYKALNERYNVSVIDPRVSTFDLMKNSQATITPTGTAGWEAFLLGKPVVALGNVFYNKLPGVLHGHIKSGFDLELQDYLTNFKSDLETRRNAYRAYYATTYRGISVDIGNTATHDTAPELAKLFASELKTLIQDWGHEVHGIFPDEMMSSSSVSHKKKIRA